MPIPLRADFDASQLRAVARRTKDGPQARRLLALAAIYDGGTRTEAATTGGVTLQIVRDWVLKLNADGPEGLIDRKAPGQPSRLTDAHRAAFVAMIESGPVPAVHGVVRWRLVDLCQWLWEEHGVRVATRLCPYHRFVRSGCSRFGPGAPVCRRAATGRLQSAPARDRSPPL